MRRRVADTGPDPDRAAMLVALLPPPRTDTTAPSSGELQPQRDGEAADRGWRRGPKCSREAEGAAAAARRRRRRRRGRGRRGSGCHGCGEIKERGRRYGLVFDPLVEALQEGGARADAEFVAQTGRILVVASPAPAVFWPGLCPAGPVIPDHTRRYEREGRADLLGGREAPGAVVVRCCEEAGCFFELLQRRSTQDAPHPEQWQWRWRIGFSRACRRATSIGYRRPLGLQNERIRGITEESNKPHFSIFT